MVYVKTITDISCTISGDKIEREEDNLIVTDAGNITGIFDIGAVQFLYLTRSKKHD